MKVDTRNRHRNAPRPEWKVAQSYKEWLRKRRCFRHGPDCWGKMEAAHTPDPQSKGIATKAADFNCIPACTYHHKIQTDMGWSAVGLTREKATEMAAAYWRDWPGRIAWEREHGT